MMRNVLKFILPLSLWIFILRDFIVGDIPFNMDTNTIYGVAKFYFNNLSNGVVPLWDPFVSLGHPFYALSICNLFNPVTLLMPFLKLCGFSYNVAFAFYMAVYFWVGCLGFYFLVKALLKDKGLAYLGYIALLFSSLGVSIFTQFTFVEIVVPTIWFFYFLTAFIAKQNKGNFLGLSFAFMIVLSSYLPFYFLAVLFVFVLAVVLLFPKDVWQYCRRSFRFKLDHWPLTLLCVAGVIAAVGPLLAYKMLDASGEAVSPGRHCQYSSVQDCYDRTINGQGGMMYEEIARSGGLGERFDLGYLFTHLDKMTYGSDSLFFVPFFIYVLAALSLFLRLDRLNVLLVAMMTGIGLIGLGSAAGVHRFLYDHIFFFKYFRNLFFLGAFLIPLSIVFALKQLQALLAFKPDDMSRKKLIALGIVFVHVGMAFYLKHLGGIMPSIWLTLFLSAALFVTYYLGGWKWPMKFWFWSFAVLLMIQPMCIIQAYAQNAVEFRCELPNAHVMPQFAWVRPDKPASSTCRIYQFVPYEDFWYAMSMQDAPAVVGYPQAAARWVFMLSKQLGDAALANYAKYKVYLYDDLTNPGQVMDGTQPQVRVAHFDVNRVAFDTDLLKPKLFVYNDAYTQQWKALIDGRPVELQRASGAFKGVWVEKGKHRVEFVYHPPGGQWVYLMTTVILFAFCVLTGIMLWKKR